MITIEIAGETRDLSDATEAWIVERVRASHATGTAGCVRVTILTADLWVTLATPECPPGGIGRAPTTAESRLIALWEQHHLSSPHYTAAHVIAFLKVIERRVGKPHRRAARM